MMAERYIARSSAIAARLLGDEMMVMSTADSTFFTLNEVASVIWQAADGSTPLSEIVVGKICQEFDVDQEQAQRGAERFVEDAWSAWQRDFDRTWGVNHGPQPHLGYPAL